MSLYKLNFTKKAYKEWDKLNHNIKVQFQKKLKQILQNPKIPNAKLNGYDNIYKIKLKQLGYRLAYEVDDDKIIIVVIKIGKRDKFYTLLKDLIP